LLRADADVAAIIIVLSVEATAGKESYVFMR
jgi:hypothetical protein